LTEHSANNVIISKKLLAINSLSGIGARLINIVILVWLQRFLLSHISTDEYALYPVLLSLIVFLPLITSIFTLSMARYVIEAYAKGDEDRITVLTSTMFLVLALAGMMVCGLGFVAVYFLPSLLSIAPHLVTDARWMLSLLLVNYLFLILTSPFQIGLYVKQRFVANNLISLMCEISKLLILFVLLIGVSPRVVWVVVATVISGSIGTVIRIVVSLRTIPSLAFRLSSVDLRKSVNVLSFGGWSFIYSLADRIRMFSNPLILNHYSSSFEVTCYHLGAIPQRTLLTLSTAAQAPMTPMMINMVADQRYDQLRIAFLRGCRMSMWGILSIVTPLIIFAPELIDLWVGSRFLPAAVVLLLLHISYPLLTSMQLLVNIAVAAGKIKPLAIRTLICQGLGLALTVYLVSQREMGAVGAALSAMLIMVTLQPVLLLPLGWRLAKASAAMWLQQTAWPGCLPALVAAGFWLAVKVSFHPAGLAAILISIICGLGVYTAVLWFFAAQTSDRRDLRYAIENFRKKLSL
jgi:O-antigen/teichoic acid export membrane protein